MCAQLILQTLMKLGYAETLASSTTLRSNLTSTPCNLEKDSGPVGRALSDQIKASKGFSSVSNGKLKKTSFRNFLYSWLKPPVCVKFWNFERYWKDNSDFGQIGRILSVSVVDVEF